MLADAPNIHATIIFATFDAEEQGLYGSQHLARELKAAAIDVQGDLNNDIIGASKGLDGVSHANDIRIFSQAIPQDGVIATINSVGALKQSFNHNAGRSRFRI